MAGRVIRSGATGSAASRAHGSGTGRSVTSSGRTVTGNAGAGSTRSADSSSTAGSGNTAARRAQADRQTQSGTMPRVGRKPRVSRPVRSTRTSARTVRNTESSRADTRAQAERESAGSAAGTARTGTRASSPRTGSLPRTSRSSTSRSRTRTRQTQAAVSRRFGRSASSRTSARSASPARPQTGSRTVNSGTVERSSEGGFVDARRLHSDDVVSKTLNENVGVLGVATRPKVLDFDARLREKRKANVRVIALRVTAIIAAIAAICALVWLLFFSTVFRLETSQISVTGGNEWVSERDVLTIAGKQAGKSLLLVSTDDVSTQLQSIPGVTQATVVKHYPRSLSVAVKAQQPAAMLKSSDGSMVAVDRKARVLNAVGDASTEGIPVIEVSDVNRGLNNRAVKEALKVLGGLPDTMRQTITKVTAKTQDSITTQMSDTYTVVWGDSSDLKLKAAIVDKLINDPTKIGDKHQVDVSAPSRPIIK